VAVPIVLFIGIYGLQAGHGFVQDDYVWVLHSTVHSPAEFARLWTSDNGFYRPIVSVAFAIDAWLFGASPLGYGLTNVLLALACAWAVFAVARAFDLSRGAAAAAAVVWLTNFYFAKTAVLWISGRTSLLATLGATLAATALLRGRVALSLICLAFALFSKEEALLVPIILAAWLSVPGLVREKRRVAWLAGAAVVTLVYLAARSATGAMTPSTAPGYYRFSFEPSAVVRNIAEYADRTSTLAAAGLVAAALLLGGRGLRGDDPNRAMRRVATCGALWLVLGLGFAYVLPVRSDLYAALPAVGSSLVAAAIGAALWNAASPAARTRALVVSLLAWCVLAPVYWLRTERMVRVAEFSAARLEELVTYLEDAPDGETVRVNDVESTDPRAPNLAAAFGGAIAEAYAVRTGRSLAISLIEPNALPPSHGDPAPSVRLVLDHGHLREKHPEKR
jgi:hypothetical protein